MICPNCQTNLRHTERTDRRCSRCHKPFALEPKEDPFGMHDERMRRLVEKLRAEQGLSYTGQQLYYAAGRRYLPSVSQTWGTLFGVLGVFFVMVGLGGTVAGVIPVAAGVPGTVLAMLALTGLMFLARPWFLRRATVRMTHTYDTFRTDVLEVWQRRYGARPPGLIPDDRPLPTVPDPRLALLCPDRPTLACLAANDAANAWSMALCERIDDLPPDVPVLILHDAAVPGFDYAARVRAALGPRAVAIGLTPAMVRTAVALREPLDPATEAPPSLPEQDRRWLLDGWWTPLSALPPARVLTVVRRGVERVEAAADPDRRAARQVGFLTWPSS
ncbi:MAG TPA: hypothetical protein VK083_20485 [Nocardia sp.]|uniref:hypothetical protein n=1 Tax=Nocardia TaxID=1817 RepID=UPI0024581C8C|nr:MULTISPECIES: hypothetical protein [Nocardia]HLS79164.1 hypothetical protein [Nocardia sp.]